MQRLCFSLLCLGFFAIGCKSDTPSETPMPELDGSAPTLDAAELVPDASAADIDAGSEVDQSQCETETCDGQDNDCDGLVDEMTSGGECVVDDAQGECEQGTLICANGTLTCEMTQMPNAEVCDGLDNDCDGIIDDQVAGEEGMPCTIEEALGLCAQGVELCSDGAVTCVPNFSPTSERCNDLDDDCDGEVDEMVSDSGTPCTTSYPGACSAGFYECGEGINGRNELLCVPTIAPATREETCNAADDDCDGSTDEGLGLGVACERGMGACFVQGVTTCTETGEVDCAAQAGMPGAEVCNGVDESALD
ncbi:MAG: MopE-related protein, partial [Bradymonadia bacterium]